MTAVVLYLQVHQPFRLRPFRFFDIGRDEPWFDEAADEAVLQRVAARCYRPANHVLLRAVRRQKGAFRVAFSISGTALDQLARWAPDVLDQFRELADTGCVEFLAETSHHSLAGLVDDEEFEAQVSAHAARVEALFGQRPRTFRNTELLLTESLCRRIEDLGFDTVLAEGADEVLGAVGPHHVRDVHGTRGLRALLRSYRLSDDIAFRFVDASGHALTARRFVDALEALPLRDEVVGLFLDYETFGEHQSDDAGIFEFLTWLPREVARRPGLSFLTPGEAAQAFEPRAELRLEKPLSWADRSRDAGAWLGNALQRAATRALYRLAPRARAAAKAGRPDLLDAWRRLTTSDHVYYMFTEGGPDGVVHRHFSPFATPYDAYIAFMNVVDDLARRLRPFEPVEPATTAGAAQATPAPAHAAEPAWSASAVAAAVPPEPAPVA